jgi:hypothetical protein
MIWQTTPIGVIRHDELLNTLLAIWKVRHSSNIQIQNDFSEAYETGFEEGLDAIAQAVGIAEEFDIGKAHHRAKIKSKLDAKIEVIDSQVPLIDG